MTWEPPLLLLLLFLASGGARCSRDTVQAVNLKGAAQVQAQSDIPGTRRGPGRGFHYISVPRSHFIWTSAALLGLPEGDGDVGLCEGRGGCYVRPLVWLEIESFQSLFVTRLRSRGAHKHSSVHCVLSYRSAPPCRSATLIVLLWRWFSLIQRSESPNISLFLPPSIRWALQLTITFISDPTAVLSVNL